ncbi:hypothetical protein [Nocardia sp. NPDC003183]
MTNETNATPLGLLTGKVVFITGASRGIGAAAARLRRLPDTTRHARHRS